MTGHTNDSMVARRVPRYGRVLDAVGLLTFLVGAVVFGWAWSGFRRVQTYVPPPDAPEGAAVALADRYWRLQQIGGWIMVAGIAVFVVAWWVAGRTRDRSTGGPASA